MLPAGHLAGRSVPLRGIIHFFNEVFKLGGRGGLVDNLVCDHRPVSILFSVVWVDTWLLRSLFLDDHFFIRVQVQTAERLLDLLHFFEVVH